MSSRRLTDAVVSPLDIRPTYNSTNVATINADYKSIATSTRTPTIDTLR